MVTLSSCGLTDEAPVLHHLAVTVSGLTRSADFLSAVVRPGWGSHPRRPGWQRQPAVVALTV